MVNIDFILYQNKSVNKTFAITNADGTIYPLDTSLVRMDIWEFGIVTPAFQISGSIDVPTGVVTIPFTPTQTGTVKLYEYKLIEIKSDASEFILVNGNINVISYIDTTLTIVAFLRNEFPADINLSDDFVNQKIIYWKYFLYQAAGLAEPYIDNEVSWPVDYRMLIAKLIVYDALLLALRGNVMAFVGSSTSELGTSVKSIETGPTKVEFDNPSNLLDKLLKAGANGVNALDTLTSDICGLASRLKVKVPPCKMPNKFSVVPVYHQHDDALYISLTETVTIDSVPSAG